MKSLLVLSFVALVLVLSCKKKDDPPPTGPTETPPENVFGTVTDLSGAPLANVQMHVVYSVNSAPISPLDDQQNPTIAFLIADTMLTTVCNGNTPLADGTNVVIMWDADDDREYSAGDMQPPVCQTPPDCPFRTVNFSQFALNGVALEIGAGRFYTDPAFTTQGDHLVPSRYYVEIYCTDGNVLWRSDMIDVPDGLSDQYLTFHCLECEGAPIGETTMSFAYPNPALNSFTIPFTLRADESVTISARSLSTNAVRTLFQGSVNQGEREQTLDISELPNGLYLYTMTAGSFSARDTILKNIENIDDLLGTPALTTTDGNGEFAMNASFGATLSLREESNIPRGESAPLDSVRIVALLNGFLPSDTTIALSAAPQHGLNLRLLPQ